LPHEIRVRGAAEVSDGDGEIERLRRCDPNLLKVRKVLCDGGYRGENFTKAVEWLRYNELHRFAILPQWWVVERTFGWLEKLYDFWKKCEYKIHTTVQMTVFVFISLLLRRY
jgi:transposase